MKVKGSLIVATAFACVAVSAVVFMMNELALAQPPQAPPIGSKVPGFAMKDYEGKDHSLDAYKDKILVMFFTSQGCPYSKAADPNFAKLADAYKDKGVVFLSMDADKNNSLDAIKKYATSENETGKKLPYPVLKDEANKYADALGAKKTPEVYIKDKEGKLVYHGAIDNNKKADDPGYVSYVKNALEELLTGKPVSEPQKSAYGCGINRVS